MVPSSPSAFTTRCYCFFCRRAPQGASHVMTDEPSGRDDGSSNEGNPSSHAPVPLSTRATASSPDTSMEVVD